MKLYSGRRYFAAACVLLLLSACSERGSGGGSGGGGTSSGPTVINTITADNAELVARSSLDMIGKMVILGNITNEMIKDGASLLINAGGTAVNIPECAASGYGPSTNQISYQLTSSGFLFPPGPRLDIGLVDCTLENVLANGLFYITGITRNGNPADSGNDWSVSAIVFLSPIEIGNSDGTNMTVTDKFTYTANMVSGRLTTTLAMAADAGAGQIGGLNAQHCLSPSCDSLSSINYQLRPFYIVMIEDTNTGNFSVAVPAATPAPPEGDSFLDRYTTSPNGEIKLRVTSTAGAPILWHGGRPSDITDTPVSGEIRFLEAACSSCGYVLATVGSTSVTLTVFNGSSVTTQTSDWADLLTAPDFTTSP